MLIPNPPLFIIDGQDLAIFRSMEHLVRYVEPVDVANDQYLICDSQGRRLFFGTIHTRSFLVGIEYVFLRSIEVEPSLDMQLSCLLRGRLERQGYHMQELEQLSLDNLVQKLTE
jgi:hypothetical protein